MADDPGDSKRRREYPPLQRDPKIWIAVASLVIALIGYLAAVDVLLLVGCFGMLFGVGSIAGRGTGAFWDSFRN